MSASAGKELAQSSGGAVIDAEFLPLALELLEAPPSPIRMRLMLTICALSCVALLVICIGQVDIYAEAAARLQPSGGSKVIQTLEAGRVTAVHVRNGLRVAPGQLLIELDPTQTTADQLQNAKDLDAVRAEIARRRAGIAAARSGEVSVTPTIPFDAGLDAATREREQTVLQADLAYLHTSLSELDSKIAESVAQKKALQLAITEEEIVVSNLSLRLDMQKKLLAGNLAARVNVIDAEQQLATERTSLMGRRGELIKADAAIVSLESEKRSTVAKYVADNSQSLATALGRRDELTQGLVKASSKVTDTRVRSPIGGIVQDLAVTVPGQVVSPGQELMLVVPERDALQVEALVANSDIGFIETGQKAMIKIDAFPFGRYGAISGEVVRVSRDSVSSRDAFLLANGSSASIATLSPVPQVQDLVYPVTVTLSSSTIDVDGRPVALMSGMSAQVEIRTGRRRIVSYLLTPLVETLSEAGHER